MEELFSILAFLFSNGLVAATIWYKVGKLEGIQTMQNARLANIEKRISLTTPR